MDRGLHSGKHLVDSRERRASPTLLLETGLLEWLSCADWAPDVLESAIYEWRLTVAWGSVEVLGSLAGRVGGIIYNREELADGVDVRLGSL